MKNTLQILLLAGSTFAAATLSAQVTVLIDIGNDLSFRGLSVDAGGSAGLDENGNYWNSIWSGAYYPGLVDTTNAATTLAIGFASAGGTDSYNGPAGETDSATLDTDVLNTDIDTSALGIFGALEAAFDWYSNGVLGVNGLDPLQTYQIALFGSVKFQDDSTTTYSAYSSNPGGITNPDSAPVVDSGSLNVFQPDSPWLHNRDTVVTLTVSGLSDVWVGFDGANGGSGYLNAMSITAVPEPSTYALYAGFLALGLVLYRRRRC